MTTATKTPAKKAPAKKPAKRVAKAAAKATTATRGQTVDFFHDGKACSPSQNRISSLAWYYTANVKDSHPRISAAELTAILKRHGITDPNHMAWSHTLANGVTLSAKIRKGGK